MKKELVCLILALLTVFYPFKASADEGKTEMYQQTLHLNKQEVLSVLSYAKEMRVPFEIVYEVIRQESHFKVDAVGPGVYNKYSHKVEHAYGIAQFMDNTAREVSSMYSIPYKGQSDLFNPYVSIKLEIARLSYLQYGGGNHKGYYDWHATLTAYNRGTGGLEEYKKMNNTSVSAYSQSILNRAEAL